MMITRTITIKKNKKQLKFRNISRKYKVSNIEQREVNGPNNINKESGGGEMNRCSSLLDWHKLKKLIGSSETV